MGTIRFAILAIVVGLPSGAALAQQPEQQATQAPGNATVSMADLRAELRSALQGLATKEELNAAVTSLSRIVNEQEAEIRQLRQEFLNQQERLNEQVRSQEQILSEIAVRDSQGNNTLALRNIMARSPDFRRELGSAVHDSMRRQGFVVVSNHTAYHQRVRINGREELLPPYSKSAELPVNVGTVATQLVGYEGPRYWTVAPPNYRLELFISDGGPRWTWPSPVAPLVVVQR